MVLFKVQSFKKAKLEFSSIVSELVVPLLGSVVASILHCFKQFWREEFKIFKKYKKQVAIKKFVIHFNNNFYSHVVDLTQHVLPRLMPSPIAQLVRRWWNDGSCTLTRLGLYGN